MGSSPNKYQQMADHERDDKPNKRDLWSMKWFNHFQICIITLGTERKFHPGFL